MPTISLNEQLDRLEANLPTVPAKLMHLQRTLACAAYDRTAAVVTSVAGTTKSILDTALTSGKTVTGQARAASEDVLGTTRDGVATVAGQAKAAAGEVATSARTGARTVRGQASAQGKRVSKKAASETTDLIDSAIDAVEDDVDAATDAVEDATDRRAGSGRPYEQWTKAELLERAQELDVEGRSGLDKQQLIAALRSA